MPEKPPSPEIGASISDLVKRAVADHIDDQSDESDEAYPRFMATAGRLRDHGLAALDAVRSMFTSGDVAERATAADLMGRMAFEAPDDLRQELLHSLESALDLESGGAGEPEVLASAASALGHLEDIRAVPPLLSLADHPSGEVRFAVAAAIPGASSYQPTTEAADALVRLTADPDPEVRDWACFGLGQLGADSPRVRDALAGRLEDPHVDTRCEALLALARLGDPRTLAPLEERLEAGDLWTLELEAAAALGDVRLHPRLQELHDSWLHDADFEEFRTVLEFAQRRCDPSQHRLARQMEEQLLVAVKDRIDEADLQVGLEDSYPRTRLVLAGADGSRRAEDPIWENELEPSGFRLEWEVDWCLQALAEGRLLWSDPRG